MILFGCLLLVLGLAVFVRGKLSSQRRICRKYLDKHVVVTGGSQGIGLALASQLCKAGARLTLIARSNDKLSTAKAALLQQHPGSIVEVVSADVTQDASVDQAIKDSKRSQGTIHVLVCCAGSSTPGMFLKQGVDVFSNTMNLNYMGTVHTLKAVLPDMVQQQHGHIIVVSSVMAVLGFTGYASYAPSKWAVRGLCDCLRNELAGTGVGLSIAYPPDTDTPGYAVEKGLMPADGRTVQNLGGESLFSVDKVAECIFRGARQGDYHIRGPDVGLNVLVASMAGFTPRMYNWVFELLLAPVMSLVAVLGYRLADRTVRQNATSAH